MTGCPNAWYRQAGFVFRISRRSQMHPRRRFWVPPSCVYKFSRTHQWYRALFIEPAIENVEELVSRHDYGDVTEDDQSALVDDMWEDVRERNRYPVFGGSVFPDE
ncbi:hypothetical protein F4804DRAFT_299028 [Jackrogersella minutella]|nr:hypothetical protein F4804DRAFT_299028 [Jackrogersella minutella]